MQYRTVRLIILGLLFSLFMVINVKYFSDDSFTSEQDAEMLKLIIYVFFAFLIVLLAELMGFYRKDGSRHKKILFIILFIIWLVLLPIVNRSLLFA